jgi:hypothetical protein
MNKAETKTLLDAVSAIDNRKITQPLLDGWYDILKQIPIDIALEAHRMARKNESIAYLEPKHIVSYAREAAFALDRDKPKPKEEVKRGDPMPNCQHDKPIFDCKPCCRTLASYLDQNGFEGIHTFAKAKVYA